MIKVLVAVKIIFFILIYTLTLDFWSLLGVFSLNQLGSSICCVEARRVAESSFQVSNT